MKLLYVVSVLTWLQVAFVSAQFGRDCSGTRACMPHQTCHYGYCSCDRGYVRNELNCFPVKKFGETCFFDVQCIDHRMTCRKDNASSPTVQLCLCDKFHVWSEDLQECVQALNVSVILSELEVSNSFDRIETEAQNVFVWLVVAGLAVAVLLSIIAVSLIVYGCCLYECYDRCTRDCPDIESRRRCEKCQQYQRTK